MKRQQASFLIIISIISLIGIGFVVARGILKNPPQIPFRKINVLGESIQSKIEPTSTLNVDQFIRDAFQGTKEVAQQKAGEIQKSVMSTVEKEISTLTKSQVEALKLQICRDWGVISLIPSKTP
ncbi:hypothetical protein HY029_05415 [Candidatus Gottesmanbacteria bacterium]|nr:hypothetical protein [Candidatus Gottesmanbacteria bacterium]